LDPYKARLILDWSAFNWLCCQFQVHLFLLEPL
jgi:hypothetical protein